MNWPALIYTNDFLPGFDKLNGRRWAAQCLLRMWVDAVGMDGIDILSHDTKALDILRTHLESESSSIPLRWCSLYHPNSLLANGALFVPNPSISSWALWRQSIGHNAFSIIGQIHTLSTTAVLNLLDSIIYEPIYEWDALICTSTAGRSVVESLFDDRKSQLRHRCNATYFPQPLLPVIPLPLEDKCFSIPNNCSSSSREQLGIPPDASVVLWLGRRSMLTKADPWPTYLTLQRVAEKLHQPLVLIECGPDDTPEQSDHFLSLQKYCPNIHFVRLGGSEPVAENVKHDALNACDIVISLVDNIQETFGLSLAEAMAAGKPIVASDWDGYRDLVRHGIDGFLIPTRWHCQAKDVSAALGWMQRMELSSFPHVSGSLAQLVQVDLKDAEDSILCLLTNPILRSAMGKAAKIRAHSEFSLFSIKNQYSELFGELRSRRLSAENSSSLTPLRLDPVRCFAGYPTYQNEFQASEIHGNSLPSEVISAREPFRHQLALASQYGPDIDFEALFLQKHS